jgi:hypothetical protein
MHRSLRKIDPPLNRFAVANKPDRIAAWADFLNGCAQRELWRYFFCSPVAAIVGRRFLGPSKWTKLMSVRALVGGWKKF